MDLQKRARSGQVSDVNAWDARVARRALALSLLAFVCALLLTAATDEGGVSWLERAIRTLPALPLAGAAGAHLAMAPLRARGDVRALRAIGRSHWEIVRPAIAASVGLHACAAVTVALAPDLAVQTFFPRPVAASDIVWDGRDFLDTARGVRIRADGSMDRTASAPAPERHAPSYARLSVAMTLLFSGAALPMWALVVRRRQVVAVGMAGAATAGATIVCFHAAAVGQLPAIAAAVPSGALLVGAALRYRSPK
jgi:hypothetical protein